MSGPEILARSLSVAVPTGPSGRRWQYHSRGDRHSKIACWGILFDLLRHCATLRDHAAAGHIGFGINHEMRDFKENRKKNLDLVLCIPNGGPPPNIPTTFADLVDRYKIILSDDEKAALAKLPVLPQTAVGAVQVAFQAKACMTSHTSAGRRLFDELDSWQTIVRELQPEALRAAVVIVNSAPAFYSPIRAGRVAHRQPKAAGNAVAAISRMPRCDRSRTDGFDALGIVVVECSNDGISPVRWVSEAPAPQPEQSGEYGRMIAELAEKIACRLGRPS